MNNKLRIFIKVIYYISTFALGIFLAVYLPNYFMYEMSLDTIINSLNSQDEKYKAIGLMGGYYNVDVYYQQDFVVNGVQGGIVLFEAASLTYKDENGNKVDGGLIHSAYAGFIYNVKAVYKFNELKDNKAKLILTNSAGKESTISIIDADSDMDGTLDTNSTLESRNFLYIDLAQEYGNELTKLQMVDSYGKVFKEFTFTDLNFSGKFFEDVKPFEEEYNKNYNSDKLLTLHNEFIAKGNGKYKVSSYDNSQTTALQRSMLIVVFYFIGVYLIADLLLGKRFIIKFFKWLLVKVFKVKFKEKEPKKDVVVPTFGNDYLCKFVLKIDTTECPEFKGSITVKYSNEKGNVEFNLIKGSNYTSTKKIKVGTYVNLWIDIDRDYEIINAPENLIVEGYNKELILKVKKIERKEETNENYNSKLD